MIRPAKIPKEVLPYIEYLESQLKTPYAESFLSLKRMVDKGNSQIKDVDIDILTPEGESQFKQKMKFVSQLKECFEQMDYFKSKMSPEEIKKAHQAVTKSEGVEEFLKEIGK